MKKILNSAKHFFSFLVAEAKKISVAQGFLITFFLTMFFFIMAYFMPSRFTFLPYNFTELTLGTYSFDIFVRNGWFMPIYFLFTILFVAFLGQLFLVKVLKKSYPLKTVQNAVLFVVGIAISWAVYHTMPYYLTTFSEEKLSQFTPQQELLSGYVVETGSEFCGERIDFFFSPSEAYSILAFDEVKEFEKNTGIQVNYQCLDIKFNDDIACKKNHGVKTSEESLNLLSKWTKGNSRPAFVFGCEKAVLGFVAVELYKNFVCEEFPSVCD